MLCSKCGEGKLLAAFYKNDRTCKVCRCAKVRQHRLDNLARIRESDRKRGFHNLVVNKAREAIAMLHVQNTHEQSAKVTAKLEQLLRILSTEPKSDGKIGLGTSISINKETLVNVARSELKVEGSKLAEMLKSM